MTFANVAERHLRDTGLALRYGSVVQATLIAQAQVGRFVQKAPYTVTPSATGWLVQGDGWMGLFDPDVVLVSEFEIPSGRPGSHAVTSDGQMAARSLEGRVCAIDLGGRETH